MSFWETLRIALRYTLAFGRGHLSVFMAGVSMTGLVLGTALLLTVLSVMNGFEREMRERILALVPHVTVHTSPDGGAASELAGRLEALTSVETVSPFVSFDGMAIRGRDVMAISALGLQRLPAETADVLGVESLGELSGVVLGDSVAGRLGVETGDSITIIVPPRSRERRNAIATERLPVAAVVDTGTELDESLALMSLGQASTLAGLQGGISGLQLRYSDPFAVDRLLPQLRRELPPGSYATTWRMTHGNLYAAIQLSRDLVVLLLTSIIGVAAFNVVSALVLIVIDQRGAIAIMRTLGATPGNMAAIFITQGLIIGLMGSLLGCALGVALCAALPTIVAGLEQGLQFQFLSTDVYPVSFIPVDLRATDVLLIAAVAIVMCVLAALYPALRAARLQPATVLHQDL
ncbi:FtsX-like permease family protein [Congregibacter litoralis]|uniref:ABC-type transport system, involved in lipoprotein release, permease component n=1 Tax=Congregibacter litoralis KT71 TaxID=314285 RepID=A4A8A2_9GAMM|nr:FtsX-like permease family protein [Congregibacter litoralis]EAQ97897.1 ABC-type transport system, involved in lipoprotein release, permease component [Congregibacter litoralis KT71]